MEQKINSFKKYGITVVVLTFLVIPIMSSFIITKILPELEGSSSEKGDFLNVFAAAILILVTALWIRLFKKLD